MADDWFILDNSKRSPSLFLAKMDFDRMSKASRETFAADFVRGKFYDKRK